MVDRMGGVRLVSYTSVLPGAVRAWCAGVMPWARRCVIANAGDAVPQCNCLGVFDEHSRRPFTHAVRKI